MSVEYRVVWKRDCCPVKRRRYASRANAERFMVLLGPEPWTAYAPGKDPDAKGSCCSGYECYCGGRSLRELNALRRAEIPPLEWVRLEVRTVGPWADLRPAPTNADPRADVTAPSTDAAMATLESDSSQAPTTENGGK